MPIRGDRRACRTTEVGRTSGRTLSRQSEDTTTALFFWTVWRSWVEIDWDASRPALEDIATSHRRLRFEPATVNSPAALDMVATFRSILTHGDAQIAAFTVDDVDDTAHWFLSRNRFDEYRFIEQLLTSDALAASLPALLPVDAEDTKFEESSALLLDGQLAGALVWGGAYGTFDGSQARAKAMGVEVTKELVGDRYEDFRVDRSHDYWSEWFEAVAWDSTWIITDKRNQRVTLLCITDVDGPR